MKVTVTKQVEIDVYAVKIFIPVRYEEEMIPNDFPLRSGDVWEATVDIETGQIKNWPVGKTGDMFLKVTDSGIYTLIDSDSNEIAEINQNYVPHGLIPGEYGDYINLEINDQGVVTNWPGSPDVSEFFDSDDNS